MSIIAQLFDYNGPTGETSSLTNPADWLLDMVGGRQTAAGINVTVAKAMSVSSVFACVRNLAEDQAKLPLITYREVATGGRERAKDSSLYDVLRWELNPEMTAFSGRQAIAACAAVYGRGYGEIVRQNNGEIEAIYPLHPVRVTPKRTDDGELYYEITDEHGTNPKDFSARDILELPGFGLNGIAGEMIQGSGKEIIGLCVAADTFASSFFANGANVGGILSHPGSPDKPQRQKIREGIRGEHGGAEKAYRIMLVWDGMTWTPTTVDPDKAQVIESRQFQVEEVARWFRMPPHKIGHLLRAAGWSTLEATNLDYLTDTLLPWFVRWEQEIKRKLISSDDEPDMYAEHLVDAMLRVDAKTRAEVQQIHFRNGNLTLDEWARQNNATPPGGELGDTRFIMMNMMAAKNALQNQPKAATRADSGRRADDRQEAIADSQQIIFAAAVERLLTKEQKAASRAAKKHAGDRVAFGEWADEWYATHEDTVRDALRKPVSALAMLVNVSESATTPLVESFVARHIADSKSSLTDAFEDDWLEAEPSADWAARSDRDAVAMVLEIMREDAE